MNLQKQYLSKIFSIISASLLGLILYGCSTSSTVITATWTNDQAETTSYNHIMIAPLIADRGVKAMLENELATSLANQGVKVNMGSNFLPDNYADKSTDKEEILESVKARGADAILTVSVIDRDSDTRYVPGTYAYSPYPSFTYYGTFWGYYDYWYPRLYEPGYYVTDHYYYLETNLYNAENEDLIWSAQTETYDPATIESFTDDFSRKISAQLKQDGII